MEDKIIKSLLKSKYSNAMVFAFAKHSGQLRTDGSFYIYHPVRTYRTLANLYTKNDLFKYYICSSALLHDTLEDTNTSKGELEYIFGEKIASIVLELTNPVNLTHTTKAKFLSEHLPLMSDEAISVKLADRLDNVSTLSKFTAEKQARYKNDTLTILNSLEKSNRPLDDNQRIIISAISKEI